MTLSLNSFFSNLFCEKPTKFFFFYRNKNSVSNTTTLIQRCHFEFHIDERGNRKRNSGATFCITSLRALTYILTKELVLWKMFHVGNRTWNLEWTFSDLLINHVYNIDAIDVFEVNLYQSFVIHYEMNGNSVVRAGCRKRTRESFNLVQATRRNSKTAFSLWKRIKCFLSTLRRKNLETQRNNHRSFWICVWEKLRDYCDAQSFSKCSIYKMFSVHTKTKTQRFQISLRRSQWKRCLNLSITCNWNKKKVNLNGLLEIFDK